MLFLLIILANLHGFILFIANLTFSPFFPSFRHMSNAFLTVKLNPSKPMVVVNIKNYATYLPPMASIIASHAPILMNKMDLWNANTATLLKWASLS
jgi:hypothetical protein